MSVEGYSIQNYLQTRVKDESFDVDLIAQFDLCVCLYDETLTFCVVDTQSQRCLLLESYTLPQTPEHTLEDQVGYLFEDHHFLMAGYWKNVKIACNSKSYTLVPNHLFEPIEQEGYLSCHTAYDPARHSIYQYKHDIPDTTNVFAVNSAVIKKIINYYPGHIVKVLHQSSSMIQGVMQDPQSLSLRSIYLMMQKNSFMIVVKNQNQLEFCNTFSFSSTQEFIYYLMFVVSVLKINMKSTKVILLGEIREGSEEYENVLQYFKFVSFGEKPNYLKYGYVFDEIPDHKFFDLFSIYLC